MKTEDALRHIAHALESRAHEHKFSDNPEIQRHSLTEYTIAEALRDVASLLSVEERT